MKEIIDKLDREKKLNREEWRALTADSDEETREYAEALARRTAVERFGKKIYFRGIIEFTNICKNDCLYCGIRRSNKNAVRYRLSRDEIMECCEEGYAIGYRTFVLQGGEDAYFNDDRLCGIVSEIRGRYPDCAITLSVGERSRQSYQRLYDAGANRYLLRHESADPTHYAKLHPPELSLQNRMECLKNLREIGYQTGCGCMVGSPYQTPDNLASDMLFMSEFKPEMIGVGPFIPHHDTPFRDFPAGDVGLTLFILSLCRIMLPSVLLPSTTALGTVRGDGRAMGVLCGCNVVMPNLSPLSVRQKYLLYDNKAGISDDALSGVKKLRSQMESIGYEVVIGRGDFASPVSPVSH